MEDNNEEWRNKIYLDILESIIKKREILKADSRYPDPNKDSLEQNMHQILDMTMVRFYSCFGAWGVNWKTKPGFSIEAEGVFEFLSLEEIFADHWEESWADTWADTEFAEEMIGFRPLDMFCESAGMVGFYVNRTDKTGLYLYKEEGEPEPLHVDFEGYLKLLALSKGYGWWQNTLVQINTGVTQPNVSGFKEEMHQIFPEFSWDEFVALYEAVRIDKK